MAKEKSKSETLQFLEQIRRLAITGLFSDSLLLERLVLKGGNLLDLVYRVSSRSSMDIDLSIDGDFAESADKLRNRIEKALASSFSDAGLTVFDVNLRDVPPEITENMKAFWGGYKIDFKIIEATRFDALRGDIEILRRNCLSVGERGSTKFKIDISKYEHCVGKQLADVDGYTIYTYSPSMFVCEKLRAICQQMPAYVQLVHNHPSARSRDFLDIYLVAEAFPQDPSSSEFRSLLRSTFNAKRVPLSLLNEIARSRDFHSDDFVSVVDTVKPGQNIQAFNFYFEYVLRFYERLESFWDE